MIYLYSDSRSTCVSIDCSLQASSVSGPVRGVVEVAVECCCCSSAQTVGPFVQVAYCLLHSDSCRQLTSCLTDDVVFRLSLDLILLLLNQCIR